MISKMMNQRTSRIPNETASFPLNDLELLHMTFAISRVEQRATATLVAHLEEIDRRKAYALLSYPSLFEYVRKELGYSESSAYERIAAMRLARRNEIAKHMIETGDLTLTGATQVQRFIKEEKALGNELSGSQQNDLLTAVAGKSKRETEKILLSRSSAPEAPRLKETTRVATATHTEVKLFLDEDGMKLLNRARELIWADSNADIFTEALKTLIEKKERSLGKVESQRAISELVRTAEDNQNPGQSQKSRQDGVMPTAKSSPQPQASSTSRFIPLQFKRKIFARSNGQCEYISPLTKARCPSRAHLQVDHITPLACGGTTTLKNLRHLCQTHNLKAALDLGLSPKQQLQTLPFKAPQRKQ